MSWTDRQNNVTVKIPKCDFHIHTKYLGCANKTMDVLDIVRECEQIGLTSIGFTDHLNSPDKLKLHRFIKRDIESLNSEIDVYFGVELNFLEVDGGFVLNEEIKEQYGFQFAIGGIHSTYCDSYDLKKMVDIQHRHHLKACSDPLIDVLVHPYWFDMGEFQRKQWPWFESLPATDSYARELGQVAKETGTAIELNSTAILANPIYPDRYKKEYLSYLSIIDEQGPNFSLGSDAHDIEWLRTVKTAWQVAEKLNLTTNRIWQPNLKPIPHHT